MASIITVSTIERRPRAPSLYSIALSIESEQLKKYKTHKEIIEALKSLDYILHIEEIH